MGGVVRGAIVAVALLILYLLGMPARAETRVALVIGVSNYRMSPLVNPARDARLMARSLRDTGFQVTEVIDPDFAQLGQALARFRPLASAADVAIVYYAGHGVEVNGVNWLLPTSISVETPDDLQFQAMRSTALIDVVRAARTIRLVILDACRDNPFAAKRSWSVSRGVANRGLAREASGNVVVLMATQPGDTAADGAGKPNSPFAASLAKLVHEPALRLSSLPGRISRDVRQSTGFEQAPDQQGIFDEPDWMFVPAPEKPGVPPPLLATTPAAIDLEAAAWDLCSHGQTVLPCERYRTRYPGGRFAELASDRIQDLKVPVRSPVAAAVANGPLESIVRLGLVVRREGGVDGLRVAAVQPATPAQGRVFGGDVILRINGEPVDQGRPAASIFADALAGVSAVRLTVLRGITQITTVLRP